MSETDASFDVDSRSVEETQRIGAAIASLLDPGDVVLLVGELGVGKTTLTKAIVEALGSTGVTSPTFTLCHRYDSSPPVAHVDCYRVDDGDALADLALGEMLDDGYVAIVEWGERLSDRLGGDALQCTLATGLGDDFDQRLVTLRTRGTRWSSRADELHDRVTTSLATTPNGRQAT
ncbi:MAG: tRNA (adenosine(37)-N6)-threonylcarbamoyltransferase complex ATPase subunit type 1 TsaE [Acidimicrobiales bacterium]